MKTIQGGDFLSEKMSEVYEAYDMEILGAVRGRGSMILKTDQGIRQISPLGSNIIFAGLISPCRIPWGP